MNKEIFEGMVIGLAGSLKQVCGELTNDPLRTAAGKRDQLIGRARQDSGFEHEQAERQLKEFRHHHRNWHF
jgi:uncharacterized protein YjbJ (UPF0337 family)